jgi:hypothetical protein
MAAAGKEAQAAARKKGGGHGRKGCFGYLYDASFKAPFAEALQTFIQTTEFPHDCLFDEHLTLPAEDGAIKSPSRPRRSGRKTIPDEQGSSEDEPPQAASKRKKGKEPAKKPKKKRGTQ